jgi:F420-non-reducing hydrogenase small subunit
MKGGKEMPVKVVEDWLNACSGCEISILNIGDQLLDLLPQLDFVHMTALVDHKFFGQLGDGTAMEIPEAVVGIVSGGVRNEEMKHELQEIRKKTKFLIALGSCACYGGVPAQANMWKNEDTFDTVFRHCISSDPAPDPEDPNVPKWTPTCVAVDEVVKVDISIPGCPTHPDWIVEAISALLAGKTAWSLPERRPDQALAAKHGIQPGRGPGKDALHQRAGVPLHGAGYSRRLCGENRCAPVY